MSKRAYCICICILLMYLSFHTGKVIEHRGRPPVVYVKQGDANLNLFKAMDAAGIYTNETQRKIIAEKIKEKK